MKDRLGIIKGCLISTLIMCLFMVQQGYAIPTAPETTNQADLTYDQESSDHHPENRRKETHEPDLEVTIDETLVKLASFVDNTLDQLANRYDSMLTDLATKWKIENFDQATQWKNDAKLDVKIKNLAARLNKTLEYQSIHVEPLVTAELAEKWYNEGTELMNNSLIEISKYEVIEKDLEKIEKRLMSSNNQVMRHPLATELDKKMDSFDREIILHFRELNYDPKWLKEKWIQLGDKYVKHINKLANRYDNRLTELTNHWKIEDVELANNTKKEDVDLGKRVKNVAVRLNTALEYQGTLMERLVTDELANKWRNEDAALDQIWDFETAMLKMEAKNLAFQMNMTLTNMINGLKMTIPMPSTSFNQRDVWQRFVADSDAFIVTVLVPFCTLMPEAVTSNKEVQPSQLERLCNSFTLFDKIKHQEAKLTHECNELSNAWSTEMGELTDQIRRTRNLIFTELYRKFHDKAAHLSKLQNENIELGRTWKDGDAEFVIKLKNLEARLNITIEETRGANLATDIEEQIMTYVRQALAPLLEPKPLKSNQQGHAPQTEKRHRRDTDESDVELPFEEKLKNFPITAAKAAAATKIAVASKIPLAASLPLGAIGIFADKLAGLAKKLSRAKEKFSKDMIHDEIDQAVSVMTENIEDDNFVKALSAKEKLKAAATMIGSAKLGLASKLPSFAATGLSAVGQIFEKLSVGASNLASAKVDFANDILYREAERLKRISEDLKTLLTPEEYDEGDYSEWFDGKDDFQM